MNEKRDAGGDAVVMVISLIVCGWPCAGHPRLTRADHRDPPTLGF